MRHLLLLLALFFTISTKAQVDNYCLKFTDDEGVVNLGRIPRTSLLRHYTFQFWMCPDVWTPGGAIVRCGTFSIKMGREHTLVISDGKENIIVTSNDLKVGAWAHVTLRADDAETRVDINNREVMRYPAIAEYPSSTYSTWLGGRYRGRIDEVRVWKDALPTEYDSFWRTTLNNLNPSWSNLVAYWKMDQEQCPNLVDYRSSYHGTLSPTGVKKEKVTDNDKFKYLYTLAYGNLERYCDRTIDTDHYRLSNRICIIAAHFNPNDGHVYPDMSNEEGTLGTDAEYLAKYKGRTGILNLPTPDAHFTAPWGILDGCDAYTIETWLYLEEWKEGGYLFRKETEDGQQGISLRLGPSSSHTYILRCNGTDFVYNNTGRTGEWVHVAVCLGKGTEAGNVFSLRVNGVAKKCSNAADIDLSTVNTTLGWQGTPIHFGLDLNMKLDDTMIFKSNRNDSGDAYNVPLPGPDAVIPFDQLTHHLACYSYDLPDRLTLDSFSVPGLFYRMRSYTEGMRGVKFILGVAGNNFQSWFAKDAERKRIAIEIANIAKDKAFDGVDLDFEWPNMFQWEDYAHVCEALHWRMLEHGRYDFTKSVSPHYVSCNFPVGNYGQYVDFFNFQVYDRKDLVTASGFEAAHHLFEDSYKYPRDKIILSYSTTTTEGYTGNTVDKNCPPRAYRYLYPTDGTYDPNLNYMTADDHNFWLNSYNQVEWRAKYIVDHDLGGIMYWDMGGDLPANEKHSFARAATYYINSNVEPLVTKVSRAAAAPADDAYAPVDMPDPVVEESRIITSLDELRDDVVYNIVNAHGLGTLCYNGNTSNVWLGASSDANFSGWVDEFNDGAQWMIIKMNDAAATFLGPLQNTKYYLYCLQPAKFVSVPAFNVTSQAAYYTETPAPIEVTVDANGTFAFRSDTSAEKGYLCASPHLKGSPVCQWTCDGEGSRWVLKTRPEVFGAAYMKKALLQISPLDYNYDGTVTIGDLPLGVARSASFDVLQRIENSILKR